MTMSVNVDDILISECYIYALSTSFSNTKIRNKHQFAVMLLQCYIQYQSFNQSINVIVSRWLSWLSSTPVYDLPAAHGPVCMPIRSLSVSSGRWRIVKRDTWSSRSRAMLQISTMCLPAFGFGNPLTTIYASPIVSTWQHKSDFDKSCGKWNNIC